MEKEVHFQSFLNRFLLVGAAALRIKGLSTATWESYFQKRVLILVDINEMWSLAGSGQSTCSNLGNLEFCGWIKKLAMIKMIMKATMTKRVTYKY